MGLTDSMTRIGLIVTPNPEWPAFAWTARLMAAIDTGVLAGLKTPKRAVWSVSEGQIAHLL